MAGATLLTLLDDIAALLDDVALMTKVAANKSTAMADDVAVLSKVAAQKTAGVLGDDLALNAQQVTGIRAERELPVVWAVAKGSMVNKAILVPAALLISWLAPWLITPLLMLAYLLIPSLGRGQTVGKKLRGIRVVSITGGDADFAQLAIRYGLLVVIAVDGFIILQQIAPLLALFGVLMWPRNKRRQGLHDRLAKTVVVDNTIVPGDA